MVEPPLPQKPSKSLATPQTSMASGAGVFHEVDLLEIYHARQLRDSIISQLNRLRGADRTVSLDGRMRRSEVCGYYKALLLTTAELLQELGDDIPG